jgi:hypothetical protein
VKNKIKNIQILFVLLMGVLSNGYANVVVHSPVPQGGNASKISIEKGAEGQCFLKAWEALAKSNLDDAFRRNADYLENISKHSTSTGKSADEIVTIAKNNKNGPEQFLDELENTPASGHWDLDPFQRGRNIEKDLGQNLPEPFKTIDRYDNGTITSIKSLDVNAKTYQNATKLRSRIKKYVDDLSDFQGFSMGGWDIGNVSNGLPITVRKLDLAISNAGSPTQAQVIDEMITYAASKNINLNKIIFP